MVTAILREASCERGGRAADLPTVRLHFYRDCTLIQPCQLRRAAPFRSLAPAGAPKAAGAAAI